MTIRKTIKIAAEQGMGVDSTGLIVMKALQNMEYFVYGEREFNSLIKGGRSSIQIHYCKDKPVRSIYKKVPMVLAFDREGVLDGLESVEDNGVLIHGFDRWPKAIKDLEKIAEAKNLKVYSLAAREIAESVGGNTLMINTVLTGFLWKQMGFEISFLEAEISRQFTKKPAVIPINLACAQAGYNWSPN